MPIIIDSGSTPSSIIDYASLEAAIASWLHRSDLTTYIPDFIVLGEARLYRELRVRQMETALSSAISSGSLAVPSGYREMKYAYVNGAPVRWLERKSAEWIYANYPTRSSSGTPRFFAREGDTFIFGPYPDSDYTIKGIYYKRLESLSDSNTTNWLISDAPDLILWASLCEAAPWMKDDARIGLWEKKYEISKSRIQAENDSEEFSGSTLAATVR